INQRPENAERKRMEESLRLFRTLIDHSKDAIEVVDPVTARFVDASESAYRDLGYTRAELMALTVFDVTVGLDRAAFAAANARLKNSGRARFELERRRKDGSTFPIEVSLSLVTVDREYAVTIVRDITEHKRTEESLRLLSSAVEQAQESIMIVEAKPDAPSPTIFFVNPAFTQMTGYPAEEAIGKTPGILQGPRTDTTLASRIMQDLERNGEFEGEAINYRKDGTEFNVELHIAPIRNASGIITHFVVIQHDITVRKQLEAQRQRLAN